MNALPAPVRIVARLLAGLLCLAPLAGAQPAQLALGNSAQAANADAAWQTLRSFGRPGGIANRDTSTRAERTASFLNQADQLKAFYTAYPSHPSAREAKRLEALALNQAARNGDTTQEARRLQLIEEIRSDAAIVPVKRLEVVAWSRQVEIARQDLRDRAAFFAAQESASRALIAEFGLLADGYASLLAIARDGPEARLAGIAGDLIAMEATPPSIRTEAQRLLDRQALVGQPIGSILAQAGAAELMPSEPKVLVLYAWSKAAPQSLESAGRLAAQAAEAGFIGICLDRDVTAARHAAAGAALPGEQYYNAQGSSSPLAEALKIGHTLAVYLVDREGIIRDLRGGENFARKISELNR